ncbi:contractile injection system tape measure protein [Adhaeribacter pallidiroseus]|uniref:Uncharacterized protein n=1 Tax=Adhaeribacter pallidiroseus TaxID=2072847 RepID=A0A369QHJ0_9BACT|nr:contractile injection system tape measure protein [Adhaeribacter pallidiroseus]RDC62686.1 hypothetical protein AHMF7616_01280 [Adhaeribacter pallidiroseus]
MQTIAINKEIFEFTCSQEQTAKNVQQQFLHYVAPQFHDLLYKIVTEQFTHTSLHIEKIEIDLGDINPDTFGEPATLENLERDLTQQLLAYKNKAGQRNSSPYFFHNFPAPSNSNALAGSSGANAPIRAVLDSELETLPVAYNELLLATNNQPKASFHQDWELMQTFLMTGDLPWWADKKQTIPLDTLIRRIITQQPAFFKNFLETQPSGSIIWQRLAFVSKPTTRVLINQLSPQAGSSVRTNAANPWQKAGFSFSLSQFSKEQLARLKLFFQQLPVSRAHAQKAALVQKLLALSALNWVQQAALFDWLSEPDFKVVQAYFTQENAKHRRSEKQRVQKALQLLTGYQLEFLLYPLALPPVPTSPHFPQEGSVFFTLNNYPSVSTNQALPLSAPAGQEQGAGKNQNNPEIKPGSSPDQTKPDSGNLTNTYPGFRSKPVKVFAGEPPTALLSHTGNTWNKAGNRVFTPINYYNPTTAVYAAPKPEAEFKRNYLLVNKEKGTAEQEDENLKKQVPALAFLLPATLEAAKTNLLPNVQNNSTQAEDQPVFPFPVLVSPVRQVPDPGSLLGQVPGPVVHKPLQALIRKLTPESPAFRDWLQQLTPQDVRNLRQIFVKHALPQQERQQLIRTLLQNPALLHQQLLPILANVSAFQPLFLKMPATSVGQPTPKNRTANTRLIGNIRALQTQFDTVIHHLPAKEKAVLRDILQKGACHTPSEQQILRRILIKLPTQSLLFLQQLAELPAPGLAVLNTRPVATQDDYSAILSDKGSPKFYVENAGLCLIAPYLPGLFSRLQYVENKEFKDIYTATRALQVVQHLVTGRRYHPEYALVLNKVLCGFNLNNCLAAPVRLTKNEVTEAEKLLQAVIEHWKALKNTTPAGFRESFLQRSGILTEKDTHWTLQVERQGHDVLLSTIPWGFSLIKLPWMKKMLQVEW